MNLTAYRLAKETRLPQTRISQIINEKRRISADTALRLARFFGTSSRFWLGLQDDFDLEKENRSLTAVIARIRPWAKASV